MPPVESSHRLDFLRDGQVALQLYYDAPLNLLSAVQPTPQGSGAQVIRYQFYVPDAASLQQILQAQSSQLYQDPTAHLVFRSPEELKAAIDRFYAANAQLMGGKKAALLVTCADSVPETVAAARAHYDAICRYLGWQDAGVLEGLGLSTRADAEASTDPTQARALGASL